MDKRYKMYTDGVGKVIVTSTFAGRTVRGVAKCAPEDAYDVKVGTTLAQYRCDVKIARKRTQRAVDKIDELVVKLDALIKEYNDAKDYYTNAHAAEVLAQRKLDEYEEELKMRS